MPHGALEVKICDEMHQDEFLRNYISRCTSRAVIAHANTSEGRDMVFGGPLGYGSCVRMESTYPLPSFGAEISMPVASTGLDLDHSIIRNVCLSIAD